MDVQDAAADATPPLTVEWCAPVAVLRLCRPRQHNAYNLDMRDALAETLELLVVDTEYRVVVLEGHGPNFCAGADLREFGAVESLSGARDVRRLRDVFLLLRLLPQITIASMHGHVIGSGFELALECDLRFAAESTLISLPETRLGFIPAGGATQTLSRAASRATALDMILTGRTMAAAEALRCGLVSRVYADGDRHAESMAVAADLAGADAAPMIKAALRLAPRLDARP